MINMDSIKRMIQKMMATASPLTEVPTAMALMDMGVLTANQLFGISMMMIQHLQQVIGLKAHFSAKNMENSQPTQVQSTTILFLLNIFVLSVTL